MQLFGNLSHRDTFILQHQHGLMHNFVADYLMRCLSDFLFDHPCQVFGRNTQGLGIEIDGMLRRKIPGNQFQESQRNEIIFVDMRSKTICVFTMRLHDVSQLQTETLEIQLCQLLKVEMFHIRQAFPKQQKLMFQCTTLLF